MKAHILFCALFAVVFVLIGGCSSGRDRPADSDGDSDVQTGDIPDDRPADSDGDDDIPDDRPADGDGDDDIPDDRPVDSEGDDDIPYDQPVDSEGDSDIPDDRPADSDGDVQPGDTPADPEDTQEIGYTIQCRDDSGIQQWFAWSDVRHRWPELTSIGDGMIAWNREEKGLWLIDLSNPDNIPSPRIMHAPESSMFSDGRYYFDGSVLLHHDSDTIRSYRADGDTFADLGQIRFDRAFASAALLGSTLYVYMEYEETVENPYGGDQTITVTRPVLFDIHQPACPVFAGTDGIGNPDSIFTSNSLHLALYSGARYEPYPDDITYVWVSLTALVDDAFCHSTLYSWTSYGIGYQPAVRFIRNYAMVFETYDGYVNYEYGLYSILDISDPCNPLYVYNDGAGETMPDIGFTQTEYRSQPGGMCAVNYHTVYAGAGRGGFQETDRNCIDFPVTGYQEFFPVYEPGNDLYWYLFSPQQILYAVSVASEGISPRAAWQLVENDGEVPAFVPFSVSGVQRPQAAKDTSSR